MSGSRMLGPLGLVGRGVSVQQACSGTSSECLIGSSLEELTPV